MSIKVYEAYRIREGHDPFELLWEIQRRGRLNARERLTPVFRDIVSGAAHEQHLKFGQQDVLFQAWLKEKYAGTPDDVSVLKDYRVWSREHCPPDLRVDQGVFAVSNDEIFEKAQRPDKMGSGDTPNIYDVDSWARMQYREQVTRYEKDEWALDTSISIHVRDGRFYLIPYCERSSLVGGSLDFMREREELEDFSYWNNSDPPDEATEKEWEERADAWVYFTEDDRWTNYLVVEVLSWGNWLEVSPMMHLVKTGANSF